MAFKGSGFKHHEGQCYQGPLALKTKCYLSAGGACFQIQVAEEHQQVD